MDDVNSTVADESFFRGPEDPNRERRWPILLTLDDDLAHRHLIDRPSILMGRETTCEIHVRDSRASRAHARLDYENFDAPDQDPRVTLRDLGSTNGTYVNGDRVKEIELRDRDRIAIGSTLYGFFVRDETSLRAEQNLVKLASSDALTGLRNRAFFDAEISREFSRARRYRRPLSLTMLDIDRFKAVNDRYGHAAGDEVLKAIGRMVADSIRVNDMAARYGGEELVILLPETPLDNAVLHADRLRRAIEEARIPVDDDTVISVTASFGCAAQDNTMISHVELVRAADVCLYRSKNDGRNRVTAHSPEPLGRRMPPGADQTGT